MITSSGGDIFVSVVHVCLLRSSSRCSICQALSDGGYLYIYIYIQYLRHLMEADYRLVAGQVAIEVSALTFTESRLFPFSATSHYS